MLPVVSRLREAGSAGAWRGFGYATGGLPSQMAQRTSGFRSGQRASFQAAKQTRTPRWQDLGEAVLPADIPARG